MTRKEELRKMFQALYDAATDINENTDDDDYDAYEKILDEASNIVNEMQNAGVVEDGIVTL